MFGSRAFTSTQSGHRCTPSAKFTNTRQADNTIAGELNGHSFSSLCFSLDRDRIVEIEDETHPKRSLACALISSACCPILGE